MLRPLVGSGVDQTKHCKKPGEIWLRSGRPHNGVYFDAFLPDRHEASVFDSLANP
jgi:hypothetical protein